MSSIQEKLAAAQALLAGSSANTEEERANKRARAATGAATGSSTGMSTVDHDNLWLLVRDHLQLRTEMRDIRDAKQTVAICSGQGIGGLGVSPTSPYGGGQEGGQEAGTTSIWLGQGHLSLSHLLDVRHVPPEIRRVYFKH
eukprot:3019839-Amphidinium_carterae.1